MNDVIHPFITYFAQWAVIGAILMVVIPKIKWKRQLTRRLFIFAAGPFVWMVWGIVLLSTKFGMSIDDWTR